MDDGSAERSGGERVQQVCVGKENSRSRRLRKGEVRVELRSASGDLGNGVVVGGGRERGDGDANVVFVFLRFLVFFGGILDASQSSEEGKRPENKPL